MYDNCLAFEINLFIELKISQADRSIIFNSYRIKSSPLPLGEGLGGNPPPPTPPDRRGANPIRRFILAKVLADGTIIFNSCRIKSSPLPLGEGLGGNPPSPPPSDRRGANPIRPLALAKALLFVLKMNHLTN